MVTSLGVSGNSGQDRYRHFARGAFVPPGIGPFAIGRSAEAIEDIDDIAAPLALKRGQAVFHEGDPATGYFKVASGVVRMCKVLADGRRHIAEFFFPGDFFGFGRFDTHAYTAEAITEAKILRYPRRHVEALFETHPKLGLRLLATVCGGLSQAQDQMLLLGRKTARERIASFLLTMAARRAGTSPTGARIDLPMSRGDIADYLGLTIETVCRTLSELKREKIIALPDRQGVIVLRMDVLRALGEGDGERRAA
ncbi:MAG: helix-turn-helix domain-containing protein [Pseudomonadota bacterium]